MYCIHIYYTYVNTILMPIFFLYYLIFLIFMCISYLRNNYDSANIVGVLMRTYLDALSIVITNWLTFESNIFNVTILCRKKRGFEKTVSRRLLPTN